MKIRSLCLNMPHAPSRTTRKSWGELITSWISVTVGTPLGESLGGRKTPKREKGAAKAIKTHLATGKRIPPPKAKTTGMNRAHSSSTRS